MRLAGRTVRIFCRTANLSPPAEPALFHSQSATANGYDVVGRFAVLETALTASVHLTSWHAEECAEVMTKAFNKWLNIYGLHSREEKQVIKQLNGRLLANAV